MLYWFSVPSYLYSVLYYYICCNINIFGHDIHPSYCNVDQFIWKNINHIIIQLNYLTECCRESTLIDKLFNIHKKKKTNNEKLRTTRLNVQHIYRKKKKKLNKLK
jgi:tRNA U38,U39,U40 pseudouridine synthase TruA